MLIEIQNSVNFGVKLMQSQQNLIISMTNYPTSPKIDYDFNNYNRYLILSTTKLYYGTQQVTDLLWVYNTSSYLNICFS
jgi:hypothetical protein